MTFRPGTLIPTDEPGPTWGHPVVAVIGYANDWAAYEQSYPEQDTDDLIARQGDKISERSARDLFLELKDLRYRP